MCAFTPAMFREEGRPCWSVSARGKDQWMLRGPRLRLRGQVMNKESSLCLWDSRGPRAQVLVGRSDPSPSVGMNGGGRCKPLLCARKSKKSPPDKGRMLVGRLERFNP